MQKLWAKIITDEKIEKNMVLKVFSPYAREEFFDNLREICSKLDIPTPILHVYHFENFERFKSMVFIPRDFVEEVKFQKFIVEDIST